MGHHTTLKLQGRLPFPQSIHSIFDPDCPSVPVAVK
jgi:hypothetical protein